MKLSKYFLSPTKTNDHFYWVSFNKFILKYVGEKNYCLLFDELNEFIRTYKNSRSNELFKLMLNQNYFKTNFKVMYCGECCKFHNGILEHLLKFCLSSYFNFDGKNYYWGSNFDNLNFVTNLFITIENFLRLKSFEFIDHNNDLNNNLIFSLFINFRKFRKTFNKYIVNCPYDNNDNNNYIKGYFNFFRSYKKSLKLLWCILFKYSSFIFG